MNVYLLDQSFEQDTSFATCTFYTFSFGRQENDKAKQFPKLEYLRKN